jgi:hypothetical protein
MRKLRRQGRDVDASELGGRANGAIAVPDREDVMSSDPLAENSAALDQTFEDIVTDCGGDPRAAAVELLAIIAADVARFSAVRAAQPLSQDRATRS